MRLLVIGGTRFVGRHIVAEALARGHDVTLVHRGKTGADLFPQARHVLADRDGGLHELGEGELAHLRWDATLDVCAYLPRQVRELGDVLGGIDGRGGRYLLVSSVSAYAEPDGPGITESAPLAVLADEDTEDVTAESYGGLKALCEYAAVEVFGTSTLVVRPTYVVGPYDPTGRYTWWVRRLAAGGEVLAPGPADAPVQVVDARDLADFVVGLLGSDASGAFHVAGQQPPYTLAELLEQTAAAVAPKGTSLTWLDPQALRDAGVSERDLPLWAGGERSWTGAVDSCAALGRGFSPRPVQDSARAVLDELDTTPLVDGVGLAADRERSVLSAVAQRESRPAR